MGIIMCRAVLHTADEVPANFIQNQFAVNVSGIGDPDVDAITAAVKDFYDGVRGYLSSRLAATGHQVKFYNLPGTPPNYPFDETTWALAAVPAGNPAPSEVALCVSFQGAKQAGTPQSRRRGRMYIGPLNQSTMGYDRPATAMMTTFATTTKALVVAVNTIPDHGFGVWSGISGSWTPVTDGWVDNAFDTQRRRGVEVTARTSWTLSV